MKSEYLNGIRVFAPKSADDLISQIQNKKTILIAVNAEKILSSSIEVVKIINKNFGYPDGIGAAWALKRKGLENIIRIPGVELWLKVISALFLKKKFYLIGGKEEVILNTVQKLKKEYLGIKICGYRNGYMNYSDIVKLRKDIMAKKPDVIFVAAGSPKQEFLMSDLNRVYPALYIGLGGSFDVYTGKVKRAPRLFQKYNLEWAYRLLKNPKRIKRQLIYFKFMAYLIFKKL
jgi:UDP-N-acetyl-D-mannosaminouronate:lipid I N-acetyl-D-mannosaminouronosyltransferase